MGPQEAQIPWVLRAEDLVPSPVSSLGVEGGGSSILTSQSVTRLVHDFFLKVKISLFLCCGMGLGSRAGRPGPPHLTPGPGLVA